MSTNNPTTSTPNKNVNNKVLETSSVLGKFFGHWEELEKENYEKFQKLNHEKLKTQLQWLDNCELKTKMFELLLNYSNGDLLLHHILPYLSFEEIFHSLYLVNKKIATIIQRQDLFKIVLPLRNENVCLLIKYLMSNDNQLPEALKKEKQIIRNETNVANRSVANFLYEGPEYIKYYVENEDYDCCKTFPSILNLVSGLSIDFDMLTNVNNSEKYRKGILSINDVNNFIKYFYSNLILYKKDNNPIILSFTNIGGYYNRDLFLLKNLTEIFNNDILIDFNIKFSNSYYYYDHHQDKEFMFGIGDFILNSKFILNNLIIKTSTILSSAFFNSLLCNENEEQKQLMKEKLQNLQSFTTVLTCSNCSAYTLKDFLKFITSEMINENCQVNLYANNIISFGNRYEEIGVKESWNNFINFIERDNCFNFANKLHFQDFGLQKDYKFVDFKTLLKYLSKLKLTSLAFDYCEFEYKENDCMNETVNFSELQYLSISNRTDDNNHTRFTSSQNVFKNSNILTKYLNTITVPNLVELRLNNLSLQNIPINLIKSCSKSLKQLSMTYNLLDDKELQELLLLITKENNNLTIVLNGNQLKDISLLKYCTKNNINIDLRNNLYHRNTIIGIKEDFTNLEKSDLLFSLDPHEYKFKQFFQSDNSLELYIFDYIKYVKNVKLSKQSYQNYDFFQNGNQSLINLLPLPQISNLRDIFYDDAFLYLEKKKLKTTTETNHPYEFYFNLLYSAPKIDNNYFSVQFDYPNGIFQIAIKRGQFGKLRRKNKEQDMEQQDKKEEEPFNEDDWLIITCCCNNHVRKRVMNYYVWDKLNITKEKIDYILQNWKKIKC
ncbi:hypothetical protein ABK040_013522 [Willaertia magna]